MNMANQDLSNIVEQAIESNFKGMGNINILIAGKTGVGKSTLINTVFRSELAEVGYGRPVTQGVEKITKEGMPLTIYDTKGLELEDYNAVLAELTELMNEKNSSIDSDEHIHVAWVCISAEGLRIEDAELNLLKLLRQHSIPTVVVLTKFQLTQQNRDFFEQTKDELSTQVSAVVRVRALEEYYEEFEQTLPIMGIDTLIVETGKVVPEAKQKAYANALSTKHKQALEVKKNQAQKEVNVAMSLASAAAATPIPFSDAVTLVPIQVAMIAKIGSTFGMEFTTNSLTTLVTSAIGASGATLVGRTIVSGVLKLIPGIGSVAGGTIAAATAGAITKALGNAYVSILYEFAAKNPGKEMDIAMMAAELKKRMSFKDNSRQ